MGKENNHRAEQFQESVVKKAKRLGYDPNNSITHYVLESCKNNHYGPDHTKRVIGATNFRRVSKGRKYISHNG